LDYARDGNHAEVIAVLENYTQWTSEHIELHTWRSQWVRRTCTHIDHGLKRSVDDASNIYAVGWLDCLHGVYTHDITSSLSVRWRGVHGGLGGLYGYTHIWYNFFSNC